MSHSENGFEKIVRFIKGTKYVLFAEPQSRYDDLGGMLQPSEIPDDGLCRVLIDAQHREQLPIPAGMTRLRKVQTREEVIAYLRNPFFELGIDIGSEAPLPPMYPQIVALSAARLCVDSGRLYCVGEKRCELAEAFEEASGISTAVIRTGAANSLMFFSLAATDVRAHMILPAFGSDYGLRLFCFQKSGSPLEESLLELEASIRCEDSESLDLWKSLRHRCGKRADVRTLCEDALFCVLPDGPHHNEVSFNSLQLSATDITDAIATVLNEHELEHEIIDNKADEYLMLSDIQRSRQSRARQQNECSTA